MSIASLDVLVVDDEPKIGKLLEQILSAKGCSVRLAYDGLDALSQFQQRRADIVVTDIKMPKMTGIELLKELKLLDPLLNIVVITAYPSVDGAVDAMKQGACDFITKPFDITQIQAILFRCQQRLTLSKQLRHAGEGMLKLEELNRRLSDLNDLKSQFLATISHEINTPLCLMSEWIYLLSDHTLGELSIDQKHAVDVLIGAYERLHKLLQQLIDLMQGGRVVLQRKIVNAQDIVQEALGFIAGKAEARSIAVTCAAVDLPLSVDVDRGRMTSALVYLLDNAVKFNHDHGRIEITLSGTPERVWITVKDSGIGIPVEELDRVLAPFYQVDRRLNRAYEGAGVGLTLAKRYAELHDGVLKIESVVGEGTVVSMGIPRPTAATVLPAINTASF